MKNLITFVNLAIAIAVGYWLYESLSKARNAPINAIKEVVNETARTIKKVAQEAARTAKDVKKTAEETTKEGGNAVFGKGTAKGNNLYNQ